MGLFSKKHSIGKTIAALRKEKGWTQVELAEKLQVSDKAVSKWEKDDCAPSVEFFPALSELFGVSIDYLMTGKKPEPEIVPISKLELCVKKDDVKMFEALDYIEGKDDNGKTILDYMMLYDCPEVTQAFFKKYPVKTIISESVHGWYTDKVMEVLIRNNMIEPLETIGAFNHNSRRKGGSDSWTDICNKYYRKLILYGRGVSDELRMRFFQLLNATEIAEVFDDLLENNNKKQVETLWAMVKKLNEKNIAEKEMTEKRYADQSMYYVRYSYTPCKEYEAGGTSCYYYYFVVNLPVNLIDKFLDKGFYDIARQANDFNAQIGAPVLNEEKFTLAEVQKSGKIKEKDLAVLKLTVNGVINVAELLKTKDFPFIKETLLNNPIHIIEKLYCELQEKNWRALFEFAVDHNLPADCFVKKNVKETEAVLLSFWKSSAADACINKDYLCVEENGIMYGLLSWYYGQRRFQPSSVEELIAKLQLCKQKILNEYCWQLDKEKTIGDLTREYFEKELAKGNIEMVVIKLCVRLEAILRSDYHYEGDFSDMLNKYCSGFNTYDDEGNDYDPDTPRILNKLRMQRNSIVHSEKCQETLNMDEIKYCINYICNMG